MIRRYWRRNKDLDLYELWFKLRKQDYRRHYVSLYRVMQREGLLRQKSNVCELIMGSVTKRFQKTKDEHNLSLFETVLRDKGIKHKLIRPYTPRHNGKAERNHKEDQKRFYNKATFYSFEDFKRQLRRHNQRSNHIPMRPLKFLSPIQFLSQTVQHV